MILMTTLSAYWVSCASARVPMRSDEFYFRGVLNLKKCINERDKSIRFGHDFCTVKLTRRENGENNNSKTF